MLKDSGSLGPLWTNRNSSLATKAKLDGKKLHQLYNDILQPLTLFPTQSTHTVPERKDFRQEQKFPSEDKINLQEQFDNTVCQDEKYTHPVAPFMKDVCTVSPDVLCEIVKRRLHKTSPVNVGSKEVRQIFEQIILGEVKVACDSISNILCTTLLPQSKKKHLHHRIITHIMVVAEQLFMYYLYKMESNNLHTVFSKAANLTRYKAQLLLDCSKFFNVFSVRHQMIAEVKELDGKELSCRNVTELNAQEAFHILEKEIWPKFTMSYFLKLGRRDIAVHTVQRETDLMQIRNIKELDLNKVQFLIPRQEECTNYMKNMQCEAVTTPCPFAHDGNQETKDEYNHTNHVPLKKCMSCPNLRHGHLLADELRITFNQYAAECPEIACTLKAVEVQGDAVSNDLRRLMQESTLQRSNQGTMQSSDEEIPPLIRAIGPGKRNPDKRLKMEALLQELNMKSEQPEEAQKAEVVFHSQAFTIDVQIPNRPLARKADVQASERIFTDLIEIPKYPPVYNDFTSEIDGATVKRLDQNLYVGQELEEVYTELIKNISTDHLRFDQDFEMEPYATNLDFSMCTASSTLTKKSSERVINKELDSITSGDKCESLAHHVPFDKEASRDCNSWLIWWKSVVNTDDYMNYISTQDLDYLKVIFQLYNSDSDDKEQANIALLKNQEEQKRQRDKKIADLRAEKQRYVPGLWNTNTIMLGGLGSDPPIHDVENGIEESVSIFSETETATYCEVMQKKMNAIWSALHVPEGQRLDMAIKYSSYEYRDRLPEAIKMWEQVVILIQRREKILADLEMFERTASDPKRFFHKGYEGTSMARMEESRKRQSLHKQIADSEHDLVKLLQILKKTLNDTVSFKGRPYAEKIKCDKTEMLYWLQQDRRKSLIEMDIKKENIPAKLQPMNNAI